MLYSLFFFTSQIPISNTLKPTLRCLPSILLHNHIIVRIRIKGQIVHRIQLARPMEHILVHLPIVPAETAIQLPVGKSPGIDELHGVRADLLDELHHGVRARELDLPHRASGAGEELRGLALERVEGVEAVQLVQEGNSLRVEGLVRGGILEEGVVEALDHEILRVGSAKAPEVNE